VNFHSITFSFWAHPGGADGRWGAPPLRAQDLRFALLQQAGDLRQMRR
jgi:hypothetical protein